MGLFIRELITISHQGTPWRTFSGGIAGSVGIASKTRPRLATMCYGNLATLRIDAPLFKSVATLRWRGATPVFASWAEKMKAPRLLERCQKAATGGRSNRREYGVLT